MTNIDPTHAHLRDSPAVTATVPRSAALPYLAVAGARDAIDWYVDALGASLVGEPVVMDAGQPVDIVATPGAPTLFCGYAVADIGAARRAIVGAGGTAGEVSMAPHGPMVEGTDPFGVAFAIYQPAQADARPPLNGSGPGALSYLTYQVPDSKAFREFYASVLGWTYGPGRVDDGWQILESHPMAGVAGGSEAPVVVPMWTVANVDAAVARVREAGGTVVDEPSRQSYGRSALCIDDQGSRFYLGEF